MNNTKSNERSAQPMPGHSKRAQELLKPRRMHFHAKAHPSPEKK